MDTCNINHLRTRVLSSGRGTPLFNLTKQDGDPPMVLDVEGGRLELETDGY